MSFSKIASQLSICFFLENEKPIILRYKDSLSVQDNTRCLVLFSCFPFSGLDWSTAGASATPSTTMSQVVQKRVTATATRSQFATRITTRRFWLIKEAVTPNEPACCPIHPSHCLQTTFSSISASPFLVELKDSLEKSAVKPTTAISSKPYISDHLPTLKADM